MRPHDNTLKTFEPQDKLHLLALQKDVLISADHHKCTRNSIAMEADFTLLDEGFEDVFKAFFKIDHAPFPLFDLPPELWLRICEFAVVEDKPIELVRWSKKKEQQIVSHKFLQQTAITKTNRLLRREALPMYYRPNTFGVRYNCPFPVWHGEAYIDAWFVAIGHDNRRFMGNFSLRGMIWWEKNLELALERSNLEVEIKVTDVSQCAVRSGTVTFL